MYSWESIKKTLLLGFITSNTPELKFAKKADDFVLRGIKAMTKKPKPKQNKEPKHHHVHNRDGVVSVDKTTIKKIARKEYVRNQELFQLLS